MRLGPRAWPELEPRAPPVLVLPLGATEQHGPHLPLETDTVIATAPVAGAAAGRDDVVAAPALPYGSSGEHAEFALRRPARVPRRRPRPRLMAATAPPAGLLVELHRGVRVDRAGTTLTGGSPMRVVRLTDGGARAVAEWRSPRPIGDGPGRRRLARRLLDAGMLEARPPAAASTAALTVIVPVRDRAAELDRCLVSIGHAAPESPVVVVDDGSADAAALARVCARHGAQVLRHDEARGPAAARNRGLATATTPYVAFVDSDVVVPPTALRALLAHFADPGLAAVAPRIRALAPPVGLIAGYEARHCALDLGPSGGIVAPGRAVSYVPSTVLLVRRDAMGPGFDESLRVGEDVDLLWRLSGPGRHARYVPVVEVGHDHRIRLRPFVTRRYLYAQSTGMLARRHPDALAAAWLHPALALTWALLAAGRPRTAAVAAAGAVARTCVKLNRTAGSPPAASARLAARGLLVTGGALAHAVRRAWSPPLLLAATRRRRPRRVLLAAFATVVVQDAVATRRLRPALADVPVRLLDELVAAAGLWDGCLRERTVRPLLPSHRSPAAAADA
jgi:mycofactocin system glycosyltransferase